MNKKSLFSKSLSLLQVIIYLFTVTLFPIQSFAQNTSILPTSISTTFNPVLIQGMTIHPENPFKLDFIIDPGDSNYKEAQLKEESTKLIKYFLTSLTVPEKEMWVNLSPYEKNRIMGKNLQSTEMGKDLLELDLQLKELASSILNPDQAVGKKFWQHVQEKVKDQFGDVQIPVNFHNKVWIVPHKAVIKIKNNQVFITESHLKVLHESDYLSIENSLKGVTASETADTNSISTQIIKEIIVPELEKEVNNGETFAKLRQIYHSSILAAWYKKNLKESLLNKVYSDQNRTKGIEPDDADFTQTVYTNYLKAFNLGAFDFIKEEYDPKTQQILPKKYFSGGIRNDVTKVLEPGVLAANPGQDQNMFGDGDRRKFLTDAGKAALFTAGVLLEVCGPSGCGSTGKNNTEGENPNPFKDILQSSDVFKNTRINQGFFHSFTLNNKPYITAPLYPDTDTINIYDVSDPTNPTLVSTITEENATRNIPYGISQIGVVGDKLIALTGTVGDNSTGSDVFVYDLGADLANPPKVFDLNLRDEKDVARFVKSLPDFSQGGLHPERPGTIDQSYKTNFRARIQTNGIVILNNADVNKKFDVPLGPNTGEIVGHVSYYALLDPTGRLFDEGNVAQEFSNPENIIAFDEEDVVAFSIGRNNVFSKIFGSAELYGHREVVAYPEGTITRLEHNIFGDGSDKTSEVKPTDRIYPNKIIGEISNDRRYLYSAETDHSFVGSGTTPASLVRVDLATGKTVQVHPVSDAVDNKRSFIQNVAIMETSDGVIIGANHLGSVSFTRYTNDSDQARVEAVIAFNDEGLSDPSSDADKQNLVEQITYDPNRDLWFIKTRKGILYTLDLNKLLENLGNRTTPISLTELTDNAVNVQPVEAPAAKTGDQYGGIDLNSANLELTLQGETIEFSIPEELKNLNPSSIKGITPVIINFSPMLPLEIGIKP